MTIPLTSSAFAEGESIPGRYTCDGDDISPPLRWGDIPAGTQSIALVCDDPDATGTAWVHWVVYAISPTVTQLDEGVPKTDTIAIGARQGLNDFKHTGYGGPCPPRGNPHRYFFKLYALDSEPQLRPGATKRALLDAMKGHILAQGQLTGRYRRSDARAGPRVRRGG